MNITWACNKKWMKDQSVYYLLNHSGILSIHFSMSYKAASWTVIFSYLVSEIALKLFVIEAEASLIKY